MKYSHCNIYTSSLFFPLFFSLFFLLFFLLFLFDSSLKGVTGPRMPLLI